jgi:hypothetical protein
MNVVVEVVVVVSMIDSSCCSSTCTTSYYYHALVVVHAGSIHRDSSHGDGRQFVSIPKKDHTVAHEASDHDQCRISKSMGIGKVIDMK